MTEYRRISWDELAKESREFSHAEWGECQHNSYLESEALEIVGKIFFLSPKPKTRYIRQFWGFDYFGILVDKKESIYLKVKTGKFIVSEVEKVLLKANKDDLSLIVRGVYNNNCIKVDEAEIYHGVASGEMSVYQDLEHVLSPAKAEGELSFDD